MCTWVKVSLLISGIISVVIPFKCSVKKPHIIYILADDLGWNDVSYHGSDQIPTHNIDSLAYHGVILNKHYVQSTCTPTRSCLMTGKYPFHTGFNEPITSAVRAGLPLSEKLLPQYFKKIGYTTNIIGKWHLGFYKEEFTPLQRGFDSHFGYWTGAISYYDHINENYEEFQTDFLSGHDMRRNYTSAWDVVGEYATDLFTREAVHVIENHPPHKPLFLYLAHTAPHSGNEGKWLEAPQEEINRFSYISNPNRRTYAAMISKLDKSIGEVIVALHRNSMLDDSIIIFVSDNGASNVGVYNNWGSNYPWRGQKNTLWEGGVRTPALIWSPLIKNPSRVSNELMHVTDWLPTLLSAAGCDMKQMNIDGVNQWPSISTGYPGPRETVVVDLNEDTDMYAIVVNNFKYIKRPIAKGKDEKRNSFLNLYTVKSPEEPEYDIKELSKSPTWQALKKYSRNLHLGYKIRGLRRDATVDCAHDFKRVINCTVNPCLFDLHRDPCEQLNVANKFPDVLKNIQQLITIYKNRAVPNMKYIYDPASNPQYFNGTWSIWVQ